VKESIGTDPEEEAAGTGLTRATAAGTVSGRVPDTVSVDVQLARLSVVFSCESMMLQGASSLEPPEFTGFFALVLVKSPLQVGSTVPFLGLDLGEAVLALYEASI
jgi:hypothetical protein